MLLVLQYKGISSLFFVVNCLPEQVHVSYGNSLSEMVVMWSTHDQCTTEVHYGEDPWDTSKSVQGKSVPMIYTQANFRLPASSFLHRAVLSVSNQRLFYYFSFLCFT